MEEYKPLKLSRPIKTNCITQGFGLKGTLPSMLPKYRKFGLKAHNGIDFAAWHGEPIYHSGNFAGRAKTAVDRAGGIGVDIISLEEFPQFKGHIKLRYWHLKKVAVYDGQEIKEGDLIGWADNTGFSTGDHVHFGLKPCDIKGTPLDRWNGYFGAIDPTPYLTNSFKVIEEIHLLQNIIGNIKSLLIELKYERFRQR